MVYEAWYYIVDMTCGLRKIHLALLRHVSGSIINIYVSSTTTDGPIYTYNFIILLNTLVSLTDFVVSLASANFFSQNSLFHQSASYQKTGMWMPDMLRRMS